MSAPHTSFPTASQDTSCGRDPSLHQPLESALHGGLEGGGLKRRHNVDLLHDAAGARDQHVAALHHLAADVYLQVLGPPTPRTGP